MVGSARRRSGGRRPAPPHPQTAAVAQRIDELAGSFDFKGLEQLAASLEAAGPRDGRAGT
jgi:hypothetical protein